jgi:chromosome transmission fidelity protein 1
MTLSRGPSGKSLDFKAFQQGVADTIKELGQVLGNLCNVVPSGAGIIVFFPSYRFLGNALAKWGTDGSVERWGRRRKVSAPTHPRERLNRLVS